MAKTLAPLVLFFDRRKVDLYIGDQDKTVSWQMPSTIFHHLEIQDGRAFRKLFEDIIFANKIKPTKIIVIFSQNIVFAIDLPDSAVEPDKREQLLTQFKEQIPFASPFVKEVKLDKKDMAIALNRDVFELMVTQLKGLGFDVSTLVTSHIVPFEIPPSGMTSVQAQECIKEWAKLELHDFLEPEQKKSLLVSRDQQDPKDRNRIFLYLGLFVVMLVILGVVLFGYLQQNAKDKAAVEAAKATLMQQQQPEEVPNSEKSNQVVGSSNRGTQAGVNDSQTEEASVVPSLNPEQLLERSEYTVVIYQSAKSRISITELNSKLNELGFTAVVQKPTSSVIKSLEITTDSDVSAESRKVLRLLMQTYDVEASVKTVTGSEANIVIRLPE
ncbi:MAG TPA: hypothetical protein PKJ26_01725 [Candidatus Woesebacteria bacterium]|nr:hypothetical protein [Candidatus Woesebacteria bacterium]